MRGIRKLRRWPDWKLELTLVNEEESMRGEPAQH